MPHFVYRSAETGEYVTREFAEAHPSTTVRERVPDNSAVPGEAFLANDDDTEAEAAEATES